MSHVDFEKYPSSWFTTVKSRFFLFNVGAACKRVSPLAKGHRVQELIYIYFFLLNCAFYQLLRVLHSCSSTQSWGSVLPSIVETRDQNSQGYPCSF